MEAENAVIGQFDQYCLEEKDNLDEELGIPLWICGGPEL